MSLSFSLSAQVPTVPFLCFSMAASVLQFVLEENHRSQLEHNQRGPSLKLVKWTVPESWTCEVSLV